MIIDELKELAGRGLVPKSQFCDSHDITTSSLELLVFQDVLSFLRRVETPTLPEPDFLKVEFDDDGDDDLELSFLTSPTYQSSLDQAILDTISHAKKTSR